MKRCARCEREIPESAASCDLCDDMSFAAVSLPSDVAPSPLEALAAQLAAPRVAPAVATTGPLTPPRVPPAIPAATPPSAPTAAPAVSTIDQRAAPSVPPEAPITAQPAVPMAPAAVETAPEFADQIVPLAIPPPAPARGRGTNRHMALAALLVVAGGTLTFAMFRSSAPAVPVSTPAAARKPAAPTPAVTAAPAATATTAPAATSPATVAPATPAPAATSPAIAAPAKPAPTPAATPTAAPVAPAAPVVPSKWRAANRDWLLNAKRGVAFELPALKKVGIWQGIAQPMLVVRCDAGRMQTFVYTASAIQMEAIDENHTVRVSFDGEPEATERWADSSEHDALFAPDAAAFARRLTTAQTLKVSYTPHNAARVVAEFQAHGLNELIVPAAKQCGWKK